MARAHLERRRRESRHVGLLGFIPRFSPNLTAPNHLSEVTSAIERSLTEPLRLVISTPPQHGKTETALHGLVWRMTQCAHRNAYVTYESSRGEDMSLRAMQIAEACGLAPIGARRVWRTSSGASLLATGIGGPLTGYGIDGLLIIDDPVKNRAEAESATYRNRTLQWFRDVALTRLHAKASAIVIQTRWHPDDLAGKLAEEGWQVINLPAIDDRGKALWPEMWPEDVLARRRVEVGEYTWASLYQGKPRPKGGTLFDGVHLYETPPPRMRHGCGVDLAYSKKSYSDYSVFVSMGESDGLYYVLDVVRKQVRAPEFVLVLKASLSTLPGIVPWWYCAGPEAGVADLLSDKLGRTIRAFPATTDKYSGAQAFAAAWNAGKVLVPRSAPWADAFVSELREFTGVGDAYDDQVDAARAAFDSLARQPEYTGIRRIRSSRS